MRAMAIEGAYGLDNLRLVERPTPEPGPGEVLLRMKAASLNFRDFLTVSGKYGGGFRLPLVPLSDGCGVVEAVGPQVNQVKLGERVAPCFFQNWVAGRAPEGDGLLSLGGPVDGCLEEYMIVRAEGVVPAPEHMTDLEVAALPCAAVTAWRALMTHARIQPGDVVVCQGTGGVSIFALQIAKAAGAEVILTSSSDEKLERARDLGADHVINYRAHPEWGSEVRRLVPGGVDVVVEVGGAATLKESFKSIRPGGHIAIIGILSGAAEELMILNFIRTQAVVQGVWVGSREDFQAMNRAMRLHHIHPVVDSVFPMMDAVTALRHMESGQHFGKICIEI